MTDWRGMDSKQSLIDPIALCNSFAAAVNGIEDKKGVWSEDESVNSEAVMSDMGPSRKRTRDNSYGNCSSSRKSGKLSKITGSVSPGIKILPAQSCLGYFRVMHWEKSNKENVCCDADMKLVPLHIMLNRDFIVTSPLKQNLLLTVALSQKKRDSDGEKLILVGRFRAFLSFRQFGLGPDALRVRTEANAGGTSTISEALSVEYFVRRFQARDIVTEMEVEYCAKNWKKVDYICTLYGQRVGVSVTRAMCHPDPEQFSHEIANKLLHKKLFGLVVAREGVADRHCFSQCILHVWCETERTSNIMEAEYLEVSQELEITDDVIMVLTVADGFHAKPIFYERCLDENVTTAAASA